MKIETAKQKYEEQLMRLPNVTGVGVGEREGKKVIKVLVRTKVPLTSLRPQEVVPRSLGGWPTDVEETGEITIQSIQSQPKGRSDP